MAGIRWGILFFGLFGAVAPTAQWFKPAAITLLAEPSQVDDGGSVLLSWGPLAFPFCYASPPQELLCKL